MVRGFSEPKVGAIALRIPRQNDVTADCRVRADVEVRQRHRPGPAAAAVRDECLAREKRGFERQRLAREDLWGKRVVELLNRAKADRDLGVDDGVDDERALVGGVRQCLSRPLVPRLVLRRDIEQDVAVDQGGGEGLRVSARISSVVRRETARPRRRRTTRSPRVSSEREARTILTVLPSTTNSTSVSGRKPNRSLMPAGIVTWPLDVTRIAPPSSYVRDRGVILPPRTRRGENRGLASLAFGEVFGGTGQLADCFEVGDRVGGPWKAAVGLRLRSFDSRRDNRCSRCGAALPVGTPVLGKHLLRWRRRPTAAGGDATPSGPPPRSNSTPRWSSSQTANAWRSGNWPCWRSPLSTRRRHLAHLWPGGRVHPDRRHAPPGAGAPAPGADRAAARSLAEAEFTGAVDLAVQGRTFQIGVDGVSSVTDPL